MFSDDEFTDGEERYRETKLFTGIWNRGKKWIQVLLLSPSSLPLQLSLSCEVNLDQIHLLQKCDFWPGQEKIFMVPSSDEVSHL